MGNEESSGRCERCGELIGPGRSRCLAHGKGSAGVTLFGLPLRQGRRGLRLAGAAETEGAASNHRRLTPALVLELARASDSDFEACVTDGQLVFAPGPVPRLRWRRGTGLEWLDARGFLQRRVVAARFPVEAFVPRLLPSVSRPDIQSRFIRRLAERAATRQADCEAFFGELWPAVQAALRE
jgi:hypothetical protein